jgi:superfamily II DNA helicase RecQ
VHWGAPLSFETYVRQTLHAGRDGSNAFSRVYHSKRERDENWKQLKANASKKKKDAAEDAQKKYGVMISYCESLRYAFCF